MLRSKFVAFLVALSAVLGLQVAASPGASAHTVESRSIVSWGSDSVEVKAIGGLQSDGRGVYLDEVSVRCLGNFEKDPAINGFDLVVYKENSRGVSVEIYRHHNPNVEATPSGCWKDFALGGRYFGHSFDVWMVGRARRDIGYDKDFVINDYIHE